MRQSQVRTALGGLETAVEEMKAQAWPAGATARAAVELYYAHALLEYLSGYDWEIRQRERVVGRDGDSSTSRRGPPSRSRPRPSGASSRSGSAARSCGASRSPTSPTSRPTTIRRHPQLAARCRRPIFSSNACSATRASGRRPRATTPGSSTSGISSPTRRRLRPRRERRRCIRCYVPPRCSPSSSAGTATAVSPEPSSRRASTRQRLLLEHRTSES